MGKWRIGVSGQDVRRPLGQLKPPHLAAMSRRIKFAELPATFDEYITGRAKGRVVVEIGGE